MSGTFGYSRAHSSDSGSPRNSGKNFYRVHSLPRYSSSRYGTDYYSSEFGFNGYLLHNGQQQCNCTSMSSGGGSSPTWGKIKPYQNRSHDLKRKMVFNLHDEVKKPIHTIILEEISDVDVITEMCMETMTSMMKSKIHRKFLHHLNNNNAPLVPERSGNHSSNSASATVAAKRTFQISNAGSSKLIAKPQENYDLSRGNAQNYDEMVKNAKASSLKRKQEILALGNLQRKVPEKKATSPRRSLTGTYKAQQVNSVKYGMLNVGEKTVDEENEDEATTSFTLKRQSDLPKEKEEPSPGLLKYTNRKVMTAEEILRTKYLRLNKRMIDDLENEVKEKGKDPGIHPHREIKDIREEIFGPIEQRASLSNAPKTYQTSKHTVPPPHICEEDDDDSS